MRRGTISADIEFLERRILEGPGHLPPDRRRSAFEDRAIGDAASDGFVSRVHRHAHRITDDEVAALERGGRSEDEIYELAIAAALGASTVRLDAGLRALAAAYDEGEDR